MSNTKTQSDTATMKDPSVLSTEYQGFDAPFGDFTWAEWLEMQAKMMQRFSRFQRAIEHRQAQMGVEIAQEVIEMGMKWLVEASGWIGATPSPLSHNETH